LSLSAKSFRNSRESRGLEVVHEHGKIEIRRQFGQQVDVVGLTVQFEQFAAPTSAASFGYLPDAITQW
jgi:hypothetical protein